jgi:hypothetical protein
LWEEAATVAQTIADAVSNEPGTIRASPAITMIVWDTAETARDALHRARKRAGNPEMRSTAFGQVLARLLEKRGMQIMPFAVGKLAEEAGITGWEVIKRMASADAEYAGPLGDLAETLELSEPERDELASAYALERPASAYPIPTEPGYPIRCPSPLLCSRRYWQKRCITPN